MRTLTQIVREFLPKQTDSGSESFAKGFILAAFIGLTLVLIFR